MKLRSKYIFLSIGIISYVFFSYKPLKFDLTEDKRFTLDSASKKVLNNVKEDIQCEIYLCGDMSVHFKRLQNQLFKHIN